MIPSEIRNIDSFTRFNIELTHGKLIIANASYVNSMSRKFVLFKNSSDFVVFGK